MAGRCWHDPADSVNGLGGGAAQSAGDSGVADDPAHYSGSVGGVQCVGAGDGPGRMESRRW